MEFEGVERKTSFLPWSPWQRQEHLKHSLIQDSSTGPSIYCVRIQTNVEIKYISSYDGQFSPRSQEHSELYLIPFTLFYMLQVLPIQNNKQSYKESKQ